MPVVVAGPDWASEHHVAIERPDGLLVDRLSTAGAKSDRFDAMVLVFRSFFTEPKTAIHPARHRAPTRHIPTKN